MLSLGGGGNDRLSRQGVLLAVVDKGVNGFEDGERV